jgi:hypothetical protein
MSEERTRIIGRPGSAKGGDTDRIPETELIGSGKAVKPRPAAQSDSDPETRLFRPKSKPVEDSGTSARGAREPDSVAERMHDPVVGWLVIIDGPGKGHARELGYGMNGIGRSKEDRVSLDFGDPEISRNGHATVTYDPRGRRFYAQHGGGVNLSYINDQPLLQPTALSGGEIISLGSTKLKFVAFCGSDFDWQDQ